MKPSTRRAPLASTAVCRQWWEEVGYHRGVNGAAGEAGIGMQTANESMTIWAPTISSSSVTGMQPLGDVGCVMGRAGAHDSPFVWGGRGGKSPFSNASPSNSKKTNRKMEIKSSSVSAALNFWPAQLHANDRNVQTLPCN